jgi:large subunit ribosomal protein L4
MSLQVPAINAQNAAVQVSETVFGKAFNETLVHQLVVRYLAGARAGTKAQKNRSAVSGGGAKPWRQKGSGRARAGTTRGPLWRTGGVTFAAQPRSFEQKLNKKMFRAGVRSILSELLRQDRLAVSSDIYPETPKTKAVAEKLKVFIGQRVLIVVDRIDQNLELATRNLVNVELTTAENLNPVSLVSADKVLVTEQALKQIEERLA